MSTNPALVIIRHTYLQQINEAQRRIDQATAERDDAAERLAHILTSLAGGIEEEAKVAL